MPITAIAAMTGAGNYKIECNSYSHTVQLSAVDGQHNCPRCGAVLRIEWNAAHKELERQYGSRT